LHLGENINLNIHQGMIRQTENPDAKPRSKIQPVRS
jgi:hypothetical protein